MWLADEIHNLMSFPVDSAEVASLFEILGSFWITTWYALRLCRIFVCLSEDKVIHFEAEHAFHASFSIFDAELSSWARISYRTGCCSFRCPMMEDSLLSWKRWLPCSAIRKIRQSKLCLELCLHGVSPSHSPWLGKCPMELKRVISPHPSLVDSDVWSFLADVLHRTRTRCRIPSWMTMESTPCIKRIR